MKKIIVILSLIPFVFGQRSLFAMDFKPITTVRITDVAGPKVFKYVLVVPYYKENKKIYVLFDDLYSAMDKQHATDNARFLNFMYTPDGKTGFVDYDKGKIFLDMKSLDDIIVFPFDENV